MQKNQYFTQNSKCIFSFLYDIICLLWEEKHLNSLCIDFGSTFVKFYILNKENVLLTDKLPFPEPCICDGKIYRVEHTKIDEIVRKIFDITNQFCVSSCFIAVQMHGYILRDENGKFGDYISWKDISGDINHPRLLGIDFESNGTSLKRNLPAVKLCCEDLNEEYEFFTLGSYISMLLTGVNITHKSDGCASGFFNVDNLKPLELFKNLKLPKLTHSVLPIGKYNNIQIYTPVGDHQLSFLGSEAQENAYLLNIGTATQISVLSDAFQKGTTFENRPYFDKRYLLTISGLTGGEKLFNGFDFECFFEEILKAIEMLPKRKRLIVGGGGADFVFQKLKRSLELNNIRCEKTKENISLKGMKLLQNINTTKIGTMLSEVCFQNFPIILKNSGLDFLIVDNEHGSFDYSFLSSIVMVSRLIDLPLIVRLSDNNRKDITKLVDMGVGGFLLPMTNCANDIKQVIDYAKYAPIGKRGISTNRAHTFYDPPPIKEYIITANQRVKVYAQIETGEGLNNIEEILLVNGIDGVFIGPNDMSCDLNCMGDNGPIKDAIKKIGKISHACQKTWGIITTTKELIDCSLENEVDYISYGSEINMIKDSCKKIKEEYL